VKEQSGARNILSRGESRLSRASLPRMTKTNARNIGRSSDRPDPNPPLISRLFFSIPELFSFGGSRLSARENDEKVPL